MKCARISLLGFLLAATASAQSVDDAALRGIKVTSGRSSAYVQFNMPAIRLWLPRVANSAFASAEFVEPTAVDAKGAPVAFEIELGIYDHEQWKSEIRLKTEGEPARTSGVIHLRYPVRIRPAKPSDAKDTLTEPTFDAEDAPVFVEQWKDVEINYDLPVAAKLPASEQGMSQPPPKTITETPGGKVVVTVKP
jgi:hypothetical protein